MKATNDIGDSEYSQESEAVTTLQDGKDIMEMRLTDSVAQQTRFPKPFSNLVNILRVCLSLPVVPGGQGFESLFKSACSAR